MGTKSVSELILECMDKTPKPLRFKEIKSYMNTSNKKYTDGTLRTVLSSLVRSGIVAKVKFPNRTSFYAKPDWVNKKGEIKPELNFNPYYSYSILINKNSK